MKNISISRKLILYFLLIGLSTVLWVGLLSYFQSKSNLEKRTENQLTSLRDIQKQRVDNYLLERMNDLKMLSQSEGVYQLFRILQDYHYRLGVKPDAPFPYKNEEYDTLTASYAQLMNRYAETYEYSDIFLICKAHGHIMYSTSQNPDLGSNLVHGEYKDSHLAKVWQSVASTQSIAAEDYRPYKAIDNKQAMFMGVPVIRDNEFLAVLVVELSEKPADQILNQRTGLGDTGESFLIGLQDGKALMRNNRVVKSAPVGTELKENIFEESLKNRMPVYTERTDASGKVHYYAFAPVSSELVNWGVVVDITEDEVLHDLYVLRRRTIVVTLIIVVLLIIIAIFTARSFTRPINETVSFAKEVTRGNYNAPLSVDQKDEIGILAEALKEMVEMFKQVDKTALTVSQGNLISDKQEKDIKEGTTEAYLHQMRKKLSEIVGSVKTTAESVNAGSKQISHSSVQIAEGANEQAAAAEEISSSMEEMAATVEQNTDNAKKTAEISKDAAQKIKQSHESFRETLNAVHDIVSKLKVIQEIAEKTDVLAINIGIEASRAGEHGKGFSVLADEVRQLAEISKQAAKETNNNSKATVESAEQSEKMLESVIPSIEKTAELTDEIATAGAELLSGSQRIADAVNQLSEVTQQNSSSSEEMSSGAEQLSAQSEELKNLIAWFKTEK